MPTPTVYRFPPYRLLSSQRALLREGTPVKLGGRAFDLLLALVERSDRVVAKDELLGLVWPRLVVEENNLQVQVLALRKQLGYAAIATVPGRGYRFALTVDVEGPPPPAETLKGQVEPAGPAPLPRWLPPMVGRDADLQALQGALDRHALVTLAGAAGVGKTRLARAAAQARAGTLPGGVAWVDLAALSDPGMVPHAVAAALGLALDGGRDPAEAASDALSAWPALVVLDNAEHLVPGVLDWLARARTACADLRVLVTSQEVLHAADEAVFRLDPLPLPDGDDADAAARSGAVALFVARAQAADRRFALTPANAAAVADVCRRLDGIPLAIELAAARAALLGVDGLRARLDHRLQVLTSGERSSARRHQTLRHALEWSHGLLSPDEQAVLRRLGVFGGGFTLEAAQEVAADALGIDCWDVLEHLGSLVDKSLVQVEGDAAPRYRLLETTRLFALERLIEHGEAAAARSAHRAHFAGVAEAARLEMLVAGAGGLPRLDVERDNLLLALAWTSDDPGGLDGLRLAAGLRYYWTSRGLIPRGLRACLQALAHPAVQGDSLPRVVVEATAGHFLSLAGRADEAFAHVSRAVAMARALGDDAALVAALSQLGFLHLRRKETAVAEVLAAEALARARGLGDSHELGNALALDAAVHAQAQRHARARAALEEGLALRERLGHWWSCAVARLNLAWVDIDAGADAPARAHLREVHTMLARIDSQLIVLEFVRALSAWAATAGRPSAALWFDGLARAQGRRLGVREPEDEERAARLQHAREAVGAEAAARLAALGAREDATTAAGRLGAWLDAPDREPADA